MIEKIITKLVVKYYLRKNREIHKQEPIDELESYMFGREEDVVKVLRNALTAQTVRHFEAPDKDSQLLVKGMAMAMKLLLDAHHVAMRIKTEEKDKDSQVIMWNKKKVKYFRDITQVN